MLAFFFSPSGRIGRAQWWLAQVAVLAFVVLVRTSISAMTLKPCGKWAVNQFLSPRRLPIVLLRRGEPADHRFLANVASE
jgi:uncharacterized membrane protein YhaH (DUF805 family)